LTPRVKLLKAVSFLFKNSFFETELRNFGRKRGVLAKFWVFSPNFGFYKLGPEGRNFVPASRIHVQKKAWPPENGSSCVRNCVTKKTRSAGSDLRPLQKGVGRRVRGQTASSKRCGVAGRRQRRHCSAARPGPCDRHLGLDGGYLAGSRKEPGWRRI
jgi:hypothetical protein